ncbi:exosortase C-terminal domain/associated protein EpsI [Geomesophilobacter sediminis]|uniref:EpsI family protein n=1 Tax=Geomesophilobacter sediminis TaxID=2798584 RepID=A0A8J7JII7_9BACT|nr:exosortase C-terminal domain/associated protein EpsI [Geomesophilobacter sediminis]MBJ6724260.1 EpsI family protein [Geomesophilobacter sediminis]
MNLAVRPLPVPLPAAAAFLTLLFLVAYWPPLKGLAHVWQSNPEYSYGPLIPAISLYLLWKRREGLQAIESAPSWRVLPALGAALLLSLYGVLGSSGNIALPLIPVLLLLFAAFCFGIPLARRLIFPLGFTVFMIPIPAVLERTLGMYLKSVSTSLGESMVRACGLPVFVSGNLIDLGVIQLQVVDACNGLGYLFPLIALGVLYAGVFERTPWKRGCLVAATLPIAVAVNGLRLGVTGLLAHRFGRAAAEGFFHDFTGWVLFVVAFALLAAVGRLLALFPSSAVGAAAAAPPLEPTAAPAGNPPAAPFAVGVLLLVVTAAFTLRTQALPPVQLKGGLASFPTEIGAWRGAALPSDAETVAASGAQDAYNGEYRDPAGRVVFLYLGYRGSAFLENENFFHSPTVCLPSGGYRVVTERQREIAGDPVWGRLRLTEMVIEGEGATMVVYFWFHTKSRVTGNKSVNRFHLTLHALARDNTYDLFVRPVAVVAPGESVADAEARLDRFVRELSRTERRFLAERTAFL